MQTVWLCEAGDVESGYVQAVVANGELARQWLAEERERQIAEDLEQWRAEQAHNSDPEHQGHMKEKYPDTEWDEWFASKLAEPPSGMEPIEDDAFYHGGGRIHGWWRVREVAVLTTVPVTKQYEATPSVGQDVDSAA